MTATDDSLDLYRRTVLDHSRHPRNRHRPARVDRTATGHNRLCGDKVQVFIGLEADRISAIGFEGAGCAICTASASMMTEAVAGKSISGTREAISDFTGAMLGEAGSGLEGDLAALGGVREYPSRIRCATLPWQTLQAALDATPETVTTE